MIGRFIGVSPTVNDDEAALGLAVARAVYELARKEDTAGLRRLLCGSFGTDDTADSSVIVVLNLVVVVVAGLTEVTLSCLGSEFFRLTPPAAAACCCGGAFLLAA